MATPDAARAGSPSPASGAMRLSEGVNSLPGLAVMRIGLGALFINIFFDNLSKGFYGPKASTGLIEGYIKNPKSTAPGFWRNGVMQFVADHSSILAPLQGVFELGLGLVLVLGLASGLVGLITSGWLANLWLSELGILWVWDLGLKVILAAVIGLATLPFLLDSDRPMAQRVLGPPTFGSPGTAVGTALAGGVLLFLASLVSHTGAQAHYLGVALGSGVVFALAVLALGALDRRRAAMEPSARS